MVLHYLWKNQDYFESLAMPRAKSWIKPMTCFCKRAMATSVEQSQFNDMLLVLQAESYDVRYLLVVYHQD